MGRKAPKKPVLSRSDVGYQYQNEGLRVVMYNPAPVVADEKLKEAEENGQPILYHRDNTQWFLTVPGLISTMPFEVDGKPVIGYWNYRELYELADRMVTWLKSLSAEELAEVQSECVNQDFLDWPPESRIGDKLITGRLQNR